MTIDTKPRAQELLARMSPTLYREAYQRGMSLSAYLEQVDPSDGYNDGLDAFSRLLKCANIRTKSLPEYGVYADDVEAFFKTPETRALLPEWIAREWRRATGGRVQSRSLLTSVDVSPQSALAPVANAASIRAPMTSVAIPLSELVAITTPINSNVYTAVYLVPDTNQEHLARVAEGTEIPRAKLQTGDRAIRLQKYGRALEVTYEQLRRQKLDRMAAYIRRLAAQTEADKVAQAIDVLVNGDGNPNTAAQVFTASSLDGTATAGKLTFLAWVAFKMKFKNPYALTTTLAQESPALKLMMLDSGSANIPLAQLGSFAGAGGVRPINPGLADGSGLGWLDDAPANTLVSFDSRYALEHVNEIGANINEVERFVTRQTEALVMTEVDGFAIFDQNSVKLLQLS